MKDNKPTLKELIAKINNETDWEKAQGMLEMLNLIYRTKFGFLNKRVVYFDEPDLSTCYKYMNCHDAYIDADKLEKMWNEF